MESGRGYMNSRYKIDNVYETLKIEYVPASETVILWNKFQIFIYEGTNFNSETVKFDLEFCIQSVIANTNFLLCLDDEGNVYSTWLKFKTTAQKRLKSSFLVQDCHTVAITHYGEKILSLRYELEQAFLSVHDLSSYLMIKTFHIKPDFHFKQKSISLFTDYFLQCSNTSALEERFNVKLGDNDNHLVLMVIDKVTLYGCLLSSKELKTVLIPLYSSPAEITGVQVEENEDSLYLIIASTVGTVIKVALTASTEPQVVHFNIPIYKFQYNNDTSVYTDGETIWKTDKVFGKALLFEQLFVTGVSDFVKFGDSIICTTFNHTVYTFSLDRAEAYMEVEKELYCPAHKVFMQYSLIIQNATKNNDIFYKANHYSKHIAALVLAKQPDLLNKTLSYQCLIYNSYRQSILEQGQAILTEEPSHYYAAKHILFIRINVFDYQCIFNILLMSLFGDIKFYITLYSNGQLIKTASIVVPKKIMTNDFLVPIHSELRDGLTAYVAFVLFVPGTDDKRHGVWMVLHEKNITFSSEHFIETEEQNITFFDSTPFADVLNRHTLSKYGNTCEFYNIKNNEENKIEWNCYLKLMNKYRSNTPNLTYQNMTKSKFDALASLLTDEDFTKSKKEQVLEVDNVKVKLQISRDEFTGPVMKISSENLVIARNIRSFVSRLLYNTYDECIEGNKFIKYSVYNVMDKLKKDMKEFVENEGSWEEFLLLLEQFQKCVIGSLPV